jgi:hypothetical protein
MPDPDLWNVAADYALNQLLDGVGKMPNEALYPGCGYHPDDSKFVNLSAEQIYEWLQKSSKTPPPPTPPQSGQSPDAQINIGDVIRDTNSGSYGVVKSIDPASGEIDYDPIPESEVSKYL